MSKAEGLVERVLDAHPELRPAWLAEHSRSVEEGFADVAPQMFLGEEIRERVAAFRFDPVSGRGPLSVLAATLDGELGRDAEVDEVIAGAAVPHLLTAGDTDPLELLGPRLAALVRAERAWRARPQDAALVARLVAAVPELGALAAEHGYGEAGDVLVHQFLGDLVEREVTNLAAGSTAEVRAVLDLLDDAWGGDVDDVLAASVVENLPYPDEPGAAIVGWLGPRLGAELERQRPRTDPQQP